VGKYEHKIKGIIMDAKQLAKKNLLVKMYAGSIAYGTNLPTSDVDFRGIFSPDPINVRTPFFKVNEYEETDEEDTKYYELSHFMKLCVDCNPNIIELLWTDESDIVFTTPAYKLLREHRHALLSKKIAFTTSGYALAQLKRIKGHNKWINNPQPKEPPRQTKFVSLLQYFTPDRITHFDIESIRRDHRLIPYGRDVYGVIQSEGHEIFSDDYTLNTVYEPDANAPRQMPLYIVKFNKDVYKEAKEKHTQYWDWKQNRNAARSELEEKFGYDTKHAMHLVRLLRMGLEALRDEVIIVKRPDAKELLDIRNGAWTYEQVVEYAQEMDELVRKEWYNKSNLPKKPDIKFAAELLMDIQDCLWSD